MGKIVKDNKPIRTTAKQFFIRYNRKYHHEQTYDNNIRKDGEKVCKVCRQLGISRDMQARIGTRKLYQIFMAEGLIK